MNDVCISIDGKPLTDDEVEVVRAIRKNKKLNGELFDCEIDLILKWRKSENKIPMLLSRGERNLIEALGRDGKATRIDKVYDERSVLIKRDYHGKIFPTIVENFVAFSTNIHDSETRDALIAIKKEQEAQNEAE